MFTRQHHPMTRRRAVAHLRATGRWAAAHRTLVVWVATTTLAVGVRIIRPELDPARAALFTAFAAAFALAWAMDGSYKWVLDGHIAQGLTWAAYSDPPPGAPAPPAELLRGIRAVEQRVADFAAHRRGIEYVNVVLCGGRVGTADQADAARFGRRAVICLGHDVLTGTGATFLPWTLEHELAHVDRYHALHGWIQTTLAAAVSAAAILALPWAWAGLVLAASYLLTVGWRWINEAAADRDAAGAVGRSLARERWTRLLRQRQAQPMHERVWIAVAERSTHPPVRLRRWLSGLVLPANETAPRKPRWEK